jgi:hypothetical protein
MANTYNWDINFIEVKPSLDDLTNVVSIVTWTYNGISPDEIIGKINGETTIPTPQSESFIPYNTLTKEIVVTWLENILNVSDLQLRVDTQINLIKNPPTVKLPLPWE